MPRLLTLIPLLLLSLASAQAQTVLKFGWTTSDGEQGPYAIVPGLTLRLPNWLG